MEESPRRSSRALKMLLSGGGKIRLIIVVVGGMELVAPVIEFSDCDMTPPPTVPGASSVPLVIAFVSESVLS